MKKKIAIFASGEGTNARAIVNYFKGGQEVEVVLIVSDNPDAKVLGFAKAENIPNLVISKADLHNQAFMLKLLRPYKLDLIVLAGFMRIIPPYLVEAYRNRILNIHPAIDKKYDGKTGRTIAFEVLANKDEVHGSRVHIVTEEVDKGETLDSETFQVRSNWGVEDITKEIKQVEHKLYPRAIENYLRKF